MKKPFFALGFMLITTLSIFAQSQIAELKKVESTNTDFKILKNQQNDIAGKYASSGLIEPQFSSWLQIQAESLQSCFPNDKFYVLTWNEKAISKKKFVGCASGLQITVAVQQSDDRTSRVFAGYGNYEEFGAFLKDQQKTLQNENDARLIWNAFCDLHQKS